MSKIFISKLINNDWKLEFTLDNTKLIFCIFNVYVYQALRQKTTAKFEFNQEQQLP